MILREYQANLAGETQLQWALGHKVVLAQLPTGGGKTAIISHLIEQHAGFVCVLAHRDRLVEQISLTLARGGIRHDLIASEKTKRIIAKKHVKKLGQCFYVPGARTRVASAQTLVKAKGLEKWAQQVTLWIVDESHHLLVGNLWGRCIAQFTHPQCLGLMVTATPGRPDGKGLGRHKAGCVGPLCEGCNDGFADVMVLGPAMRWLIDEGYLCDYDVACPPSDMRLDEAPKGSDGEYTSDQRRRAARASHIVGDVPKHYLHFARGLSGVTFCGDIDTATQTVAEYRRLGVTAELITGETDTAIRDQIFDRAEAGTLNQIVAVDVISEGVDCLDSETQILTRSGWKFYEEITPDDQCYSVNTDTGRMEVTPILACGERAPYPGERVWEASSQHSDIRVTEGHLVYFQSKHPKKPEGRSGRWHVSTARLIYERQQPFALPLSAEGDFPGLPLSNDEMHLIGWFLSDGYMSRDSNRTALIIGQSKPEGIEQIKALLGRLGWDFTTRVRTIKSGYGSTMPAWEFRIPKGTQGGSMARKGWKSLIGYVNPEKSIPDCFHSMTREQFSYLWKGLMEGDGSDSNGSRSGSLTCGRKDHMEAFTHLAVVRGFAVMHGEYAAASGRTIYNIRVRDTKWMMLQPKDARGARFSLSPAKPDDSFWCVKNRNGTIVTRRRGKVAILGNCPALQVGSFARLTASIITWQQQIGRLLRPMATPQYLAATTREERLAAIAASAKPRALLIDHVDGFRNPNLGPPDRPRPWSLEPRDKRSKGQDDDDIPMRVCTNPDIVPATGRRCFAPYPRTQRKCPKCQYEPQPQGRATPEQVDGDLQLMDPAALAELQGRVFDPTLDRLQFAAVQQAKGARSEWIGRHWAGYRATCDAQEALRTTMDTWAGQLHAEGRADWEIQREHFGRFGVDVLTAQGLQAADALALKERIDRHVNRG